MQATLALQPYGATHLQIDEETLTRRLTRGDRFVAHDTLHPPAEEVARIGRHIGSLLSQQTRHLGQAETTAHLLAAADEREKIECTKIHRSNPLNASLPRKTLVHAASPDLPRILRAGARFATLRGQTAKRGIITGKNLWRQKVFAQNPLHLQALMTHAMRPPLILASSSPYRRELLERLRLPFEIVVPAIDETPAPGESPDQTALRLARQKAEKVAAAHAGALVIGSDQVATLDGKQVGKPGDHARALAQLHWMRGRTVTFHSALCLYDGRTGQHQSEDVRTLATFRSLSDGELDAYLHLEHPYDVAGSAKSEGLGIALLERVESPDPTALVGLPLIALTTMLRNVHYPLFA